MKTIVVRECGEKEIPCDYMLDLEVTKINDCLGCFTCWVKTPGRCVHKDLDDFYHAYVNADKMLVFSKVEQGFISGKMKTLFDRTIPNYLPYIGYKTGESMHYPRYEKYPEVEVYYEGDFASEEERAIYVDYMHRLFYQFLCKCDVVVPISQYREKESK